MAQCEVEQHFIYILRLTQDEALFLRDLTRNNLMSVCSCSGDDVPEADHLERETIFRAVNEAINCRDG